jgi:hypothetical protein
MIQFVHSGPCAYGSSPSADTYFTHTGAEAGRPVSHVYLPLVPLRIPDDGRSSVRVVWTASASNLKGRLDGEFDLAVAPAAFDMESVFHADEQSSDEPEDHARDDYAAELSRRDG